MLCADHSRCRAATLASVAVLMAALAGCAPGYLGRKIDIPAPIPELRQGGPAGLLLEGPVAPYVPDALVDTIIGDKLVPWLTPIERKSLAEASQRAAVAPTASVIAWQAVDGAGTPTANGTATPVHEVYRSMHGRICRDVRQAVAKDDAPRLQQVTLCREDEGAGLYLWVVAAEN